MRRGTAALCPRFLQFLPPSLHSRPLLLSSRTKPSRAARGSLNADDDQDGDSRSHHHPISPPASREPWDGSFRLHKPRGQHLLANPRVLDAILRRARVRPSDTVLEVGPGTGNLTVRLLASAHRVVAVEIDPRMVDALRARVSQLGLDDRLTVILDDAVKTQFPEFDLCVANIPYGISSPLIAKLLFGPCRFRSATLLLQKEYAHRLVAVPGDSEYNRLAANVRLVADVELLMDVSKRDFVPCPKVDSSLVEIRQRPGVPEVDVKKWLAFTRVCFSKKNKTLGAIFKQKKKVLELFERSRTTKRGCASAAEDDGRFDGAFDDCESDDDNGNDAISREGIEREDKEAADATEVALFKDKIVGILKAGGFESKRPSKLSNNELIRLLRLFTQEDILFH